MPIACIEKIKVMNENYVELQALFHEFLEDGVLMGCSEEMLRKSQPDGIRRAERCPTSLRVGRLLAGVQHAATRPASFVAGEIEFCQPDIPARPCQ